VKVFAAVELDLFFVACCTSIQFDIAGDWNVPKDKDMSS